MIKKNLIEDYLINALPYFDNLLTKYRGNCEDLSLNKHLKNLGIKPIFTKGKFLEMDKRNGYSE